MKKLFAFLILLLIMPLSVNAHAGLSSSTPMEGEALDVSPEEIRFQFDSAIQQGAMTIVDESGSEIALSDVSPKRWSWLANWKMNFRTAHMLWTGASSARTDMKLPVR